MEPDLCSSMRRTRFVVTDVERAAAIRQDVDPGRSFLHGAF